MIEAVQKRGNILIVDGYEQVRTLLENLLAAAHDRTVPGSAKDAIRLLAINFEPPLSDKDKRGIDESDLIPFASNETPGAVLVMISARSTNDRDSRALPAAAQVETLFSLPTSNITIDECCSLSDAAGSLMRLTPRQTEVLGLIAKGKTTKQVALELNISVKTVETHRTQLMDRLEIHDIAGLVRFAIKVGLVRLDDEFA